MLKTILIILVVLIVVFVLIVVTRPADFRIARSAAMNASPAVLFEQVNDLHKWQAWSPWAKLDPNAKQTFEGPVAGKGAIFRWAGNNQVGEGSMTITESKPNDLVRFRLDFLKPFAGTNSAEFTFQPQNGQTLVTWSMSGRNTNFICKAVSLVMNCDKMVGTQFEKGLADLKSIAESAPKQ